MITWKHLVQFIGQRKLLKKQTNKQKILGGLQQPPLRKTRVKTYYLLKNRRVRKQQNDIQVP